MTVGLDRPLEGFGGEALEHLDGRLAGILETPQEILSTESPFRGELGGAVSPVLRSRDAAADVMALVTGDVKAEVADGVHAFAGALPQRALGKPLEASLHVAPVFLHIRQDVGKYRFHGMAPKAVRERWSIRRSALAIPDFAGKLPNPK
jgi:hypothetical protein